MSIIEQFKKKLTKAKNILQVNQLMLEYIGKKGQLYDKKLEKYELKELKDSIKQLCNQKKSDLENQEDLSISFAYQPGQTHQLEDFKGYLINIARSLDFKELKHNHISDGFYNFESLGVGKNHPARDLEQTFYMKKNFKDIYNSQLLRTHTSVVQNEAISQGLSKAFSIGEVYRRDNDATHLPMFHQMEFINVGSISNFQDLKRFITIFLGKVFQKSTKLRFRPSFFPFTDISYEVDIFFNNKWLEILGCGIINPIVFEKANKKPQLGWAMGCGVERLLMIKENITDIRSFYNYS